MATFTHVDRTEANRTMFDDIDEVQRKTKDAIVHMHRDTARAAEAGTSSLEELREQGQRLVTSSIFTFRVKSTFHTESCSQ